MTRKLFASALFAGLLAGFASAALQQWLTVPLILHAELYETGALVHSADGAPAAHDHGAHDHGASAAADAGPATGAAAEDRAGGLDIKRAALTFLMTVLAMSGFGLLLVAGFALAERLTGARIDLRAGLLWGAAGFVSTQLLTGAGLPPELPGSAAAALEGRQLWWAFAALSSAAGLATLAFVETPLRWAGLALLALPLVIGAPHPDEFWGAVPPELAGLFSARSLLVGAVAWTVLGAAAGWLWSRDDAAA